MHFSKMHFSRSCEALDADSRARRVRAVRLTPAAQRAGEIMDHGRNLMPELRKIWQNQIERLKNR